MLVNNLNFRHSLHCQEKSEIEEITEKLKQLHYLSWVVKEQLCKTKIDTQLSGKSLSNSFVQSTAPRAFKEMF